MNITEVILSLAALAVALFLTSPVGDFLGTVVTGDGEYEDAVPDKLQYLILAAFVVVSFVTNAGVGLAVFLAARFQINIARRIMTRSLDKLAEKVA